MSFLFPTFLFGLLAISIPVVIHLFNFRKYKKIYFTNVQFLKELKEESDNKSKLKEWLILLCRILAISCLVFAFAQPFIPGKKKLNDGKKTISIYIDNSFSMENTNKKGTLLENAKQRALEILAAYQANDQFHLITNDFEGKHQRLLSKEEFVEYLNEIKISPASKTLSNVLKRQQHFLEISLAKNKSIFLLSDFQKNSSDISTKDIDTSVLIYEVPILSSEINNVYIDSVWFQNPKPQFNSQETVNATVINNSSKSIDNGTLKLFINGAQVSLSSFSAIPGEKKEVAISFKVKEKGINKGILMIEDYPVTYDDRFYFCFDPTSLVNVLVINGKDSKTSNHFKSLLEHDSLFNFQENNERSINYDVFPKVNVIILNELYDISTGLISELQKFINGGGSLVVFPALKINASSYAMAFQNLRLPKIELMDTAKTKAQQIILEQNLYQGVFDKENPLMDLPKVFAHYEFVKNNHNVGESCILLQNGSPFLSRFTNGKGKIYLFSVASDELSSSFLKHSIFVPTIYRIAMLSLNSSAISYKTASNEIIPIANSTNFADNPLHLTSENKQIDIIPEHKLLDHNPVLFTQNQIMDAGYYNLVQKNQTLNTIAFNFDRRESDMRFYSKEELIKTNDALNLKNIRVMEPDEKTLTYQLKEIGDGKKLWKMFLILTLLFLAAEIFIIRLFK